MNNNLGNKQTMAKNIRYFMNLHNVNQSEVCNILNIPMPTFSDWVNAKTYPRIDKIEMMANYFGISKADLVEERNAFKKEENIHFDDVEKDIIDKYRETDEYGRETVRFTVNREYKRTKEQQQKERSVKPTNLIDNELERMNDQQLINIPAVARRRDYSEPFELNLTKEQIERIKNAPSVTSDDDL